MSDLTVIHDPALEIAAIVDLDTNQGWGPICVGPNSAELLQAYVDGMPFDLTILTAEQATNIFMSVFRDQAAADIQNAATPGDDPVVTGDDPVAVAAASGATGPVDTSNPVVPVAPSDADMAADQSQTGEVIEDPTNGAIGTVTRPPVAVSVPDPAPTDNCLVCNASGAGSSNPACVVCGGTGKVAAAT